MRKNNSKLTPLAPFAKKNISMALRCLAMLVGTIGILTGADAENNSGLRKVEEFSCGEAIVEFLFHRETDDVIVSAIKVSRGELSTTLWYEGVGIVGGACVPNRLNKPTIVFQAYCNGSGCSNENWGIIAPQTLQVLLVPNDWNYKDARKILGRDLPDIKMMYLYSR